MKYKIRYNIIKVFNHLFFAYKKLVFKLKVFILLFIKIIKVNDFI